MIAPGPAPRRFESPTAAVADFVATIAAARPLVRAYRGGLDSRLRECVMVAVSEVNACGGCTQVHRRWALHDGVSAQELDAIGAGDLACLDARTRAAVVYAGELAERRFRRPVSAEVAQAAARHHSPDDLEQVTAVARAMALANLTVTGLLSRRETPAGPPAAHPFFARVWSLMASLIVSDHRRAELLSGLSGRVIEIGCGDGRNFRHYPDDVSEVVAVEPEPYLRGVADAAARAAHMPVAVVNAVADDLPVADGSCDAVVVSLVLCSVADQKNALSEIVRVLRPGGELRFFEHVAADHRLASGFQRSLDSSGVWPRLAGGCHLARDTVATINASGLSIERLRRFRSGPLGSGVPFVLGIARLVAP